MQTSRAAKRRGRSNSIAGAKRMALIEPGLEPTPERLRHGPMVRQKRVSMKAQRSSGRGSTQSR
jgi:hypothetical protein